MKDHAFDIFNKAEENFFENPQFDFEHIPYLNDEKVLTYLSGLLTTINNFGDSQGDRITVLVLNTDMAQGMARGRNIFIFKGMLWAIKNEAELIAFMGHEVGHIEL